MNVTLTALNVTKPELTTLRKAADLLQAASTLTSGVADLTELYFTAGEASDSVDAVMKQLELPNVSDGHAAVEEAGKEGQT